VFNRVGEAYNTTGTTGTTSPDIKMFSLGIGYKF
jgi:hypothetical protein